MSKHVCGSQLTPTDVVDFAKLCMFGCGVSFSLLVRVQCLYAPTGSASHANCVVWSVQSGTVGDSGGSLGGGVGGGEGGGNGGGDGGGDLRAKRTGNARGKKERLSNGRPNGGGGVGGV